MTLVKTHSCVLLTLSLCLSVLAINVPTGCKYKSGDFECNFRTALPLDADDFSPPPQRLTITDIGGLFGENDFINFDLVNTSRFDPNFDATLSLQCFAGTGSSSIFQFDNSTFYGMSFYQNVQFVGCDIEYLVEGAFQYFRELNYLGFQGGYLNMISMKAFRGLDIRPDPDAVVPLGELSFVDVDIIPGGFGNGLLDPLDNLAILTVTHSKVSVILEDSFKNLHSVHTLTLDDNTFSYMLETSFRNMTALSKVSLVAIPWICTCQNMWFLTKFPETGVSFDSEVVCAEPAAWNGYRASNYITDKCELKKCEQGTIPSIDFGVVCVTYLQIVIYTASFLAFLKMLSMIIICYKTRKQAFNSGGSSKGIRMMTPRRPPPRQAAPVGHHHPFHPSKQMLYAKGQGHPGASFA